MFLFRNNWQTVINSFILLRLAWERAPSGSRYMMRMLDCSNAQAKQRRKGVVKCGFTVCGHVILLPKRYRWFWISWRDGHVCVQNNSKLWLMFCIIIESISRKTFFSIVLYTNMAAVTSGETIYRVPKPGRKNVPCTHTVPHVKHKELICPAVYLTNLE